MILEFLDIINIATIVPLLFYSGFLIFSRKVNRKSSKYLSLFLFTNGFYLLNFFLIRIRENISLDLTYFHYIGSSFSFIFGPALLFYTKSIVFKNFKFSKSDLLHFLPFILSLCYYFFRIDGFRIEYYAIKYFHIVIYFIPVFLFINEYHKSIREHFSSIEKINLTRLMIIYSVFLILVAIDIAAFILFLLKTEDLKETQNVLLYFSLILNFIFANSMLYFSLTYPESSIVINSKKKKKYEKSKLTDLEKKSIEDSILHLIESEKIYMIPSVSINDFAEKLQIPSRYLSQVINESLNKNFYDLINFYRIENAKELLKIDQNPKTILEILYEVGFSSKSAFNAAFKKFTGTTPTKYRER